MRKPYHTLFVLLFFFGGLSSAFARSNEIDTTLLQELLAKRDSHPFIHRETSTCMISVIWPTKSTMPIAAQSVLSCFFWGWGKTLHISDYHPL